MPSIVFGKLKDLAKQVRNKAVISSEEEQSAFEKQEKVVKRLRKYTRHKFIRVTDRGNSAIFTAMYIAKKKNPKPHLLIPDQGGWVSFRRYPHFFNFNVKEVKTMLGVIDLEDLKEKVENASALFITSFGGYFAEQPLKEISNICHENGCLLIEDVSGSLGDKKLCNGRLSDMIVGSFCKWGTANLGYGGFISTSRKEYFDIASDALSLTKVPPSFYKEVLPFLNRRRLNALLELAENVKKDLKKNNFKVLHEKSRGLNVLTEFNPEVIVYCNEKNYPYILCPHYSRVNEKAISIELKRLENEFFEKD